MRYPLQEFPEHNKKHFTNLLLFYLSIVEFSTDLFNSYRLIFQLSWVSKLCKANNCITLEHLVLHFFSSIFCRDLKISHEGNSLKSGCGRWIPQILHQQYLPIFAHQATS